MATTKFKGQPVKVIGEFIKVGSVAPDFELVKTDLSSFSLKELNGKNVILNIFPSLDTGVCATSVRKFNKLAAGLPDTVVLAISKDLPFAHARFCTTEGIENVILCLISVFPILMKTTGYAWPTDRLQVYWRVR